MQSIIEKELLENMKVFDFELDDADMAVFNGLDKHLRKIVPIVTLKDGTVEPRDLHSIHYAWNENDTDFF